MVTLHSNDRIHFVAGTYKGYNGTYISLCRSKVWCRVMVESYNGNNVVTKVHIDSIGKKPLKVGREKKVVIELDEDAKKNWRSKA